MISLAFRGWGKFFASYEQGAVQDWLKHVGDRSLSAFRQGMSGSHAGRVYRFRGRGHRASRSGEYPAKRSGALYSSAQTQVSRDKMEIGTNKHYAIYLRTGTSKMKRRKMSDEALKDGMKTAGRPQRWARWKR